MDLLQISLVFLIALLTIFLTITGFQVFLIMRDMKRTLDRINEVLFEDTKVKPNIHSQSQPVNNSAVDLLKQNIKKPSRPSASRFFKKTL